MLFTLTGVSRRHHGALGSQTRPKFLSCVEGRGRLARDLLDVDVGIVFPAWVLGPGLGGILPGLAAGT